MLSTLIIMACLSSYVASTPLMVHKENPENIIFFPGDEDVKLMELDGSIYNMREQNGGTFVNSDGYLSQDNLTTPKQLRELLNAYLFGVIYEDYVSPKVSVFKMSATIQRFTVLKTYFRELQDLSLEEDVLVVLRKGFEVNFDPDQILLSTWNQFCPRSVNGKVHSLVKTFECILAVDKNSSYAIFISDDTDPCLLTQPTSDEDNVPTELKDVSSDMNFLDFMTPKGVMTPSTNETTEANVSPITYVSDYENDVPSNNSNYHCFQLKYGSWCLTLSYSRGYLGTCGRHNLFYYSGYPGNQRIYYPYTRSCLDRQSCHSSWSNVRYSSCYHCGAIHWDVRSDGTLREDRGANCIYISGYGAYIHHSNRGCACFRKIWTTC